MKVAVLLLAVLVIEISAFYIESTKTLSQRNVLTVSVIGNFAYFGGDEQINKFDLTTGTQVNSYTGFEASCSFVWFDGTKNWVIFAGGDGVFKVDPDNLESPGSFNPGDSLDACTVWGNYGYFGGYSMHKVDLTTMTEVDFEGTWPGDLGYMFGWTYNNAVYFTNFLDGILAKFDTATLERTAYDFGVSEYTWAAAADGKYAYIGTWSPPNSIVIKFDMDNGNVVDTLMLDDVAVASLAFIHDGNLYIADEYITRIDLETFTVTGSLLLPGSWQRAAAIYDGVAWIGTYNHDGSFWAVNIDEGCPDAFGGYLAHGESRDVYSADTFCGDTCDAVKGQITCKNKHLSGDIFMRSECCTPNPSCPCDAPGGLLEDGACRTVYLRYAPCESTGDTCASLQGDVTCVDGKLTGDTSYKWTSCNSDEEACPCTSAPGGTLHSGETRNVARSVKGTYVPSKVSCENGDLFRHR